MEEKIKKEIIRNGHVYVYKQQVNDRMYLYEEKNLGYKECFLISDLVKLPDLKTNGERKWAEK